jgi:hypothetical protein
MSKHFSTNRSTRRSFLRTTVIGATGLALVEFGAPKKAWAGTYNGQVSQSHDNAQATSLGLTEYPNQLSFYQKHILVVGLRFQTVNIPKSTTILSATVTWDLVVAASKTGQSVQIFGEKPVNGNSASFDPAEDISQRPVTNADTVWPVPMTTGVYNITTDGTHPLSAVIQEIINLTNWQSGNALSLIVNVNDCDSACNIEGYDGSHMNAAKLSISY